MTRPTAGHASAELGVDPDGRPLDDLLEAVHAQLATRHMAHLIRFPTTTQAFVGFASEFGEPLTYYGTNGVGAHSQHPAIHQVQYDADAAARGELHALDGPLDIHSAQSLRTPRPSFFLMLMVNAGWQEDSTGCNGESVLIPWQSAWEAIKESDSDRYRLMREALLQPIPYPDGVERSLVYRLPGATSDTDLGVRFKYDLLPHLVRTLGRDDPLVRRVEYFADVARACALVKQLHTGDLVLLDNHRWGHGRRSVRGQRNVGDGVEVNPRELWSLTLA